MGVAPAQRANAVIAGVNKAGTTSLFMSLAAHPQVATSSVKETRYFLPARYGKPLDPVSVYESYFAHAGSHPVRLEATPAYFYGGQALVDRVTEVLRRPKVILVFREPVSRLVSFFTFQKTRLRIPETMTLEEYLAIADRLTDHDFADPENERYFGFRGGCYAEFLPPWIDAFGSNLRVLFFEDLMAAPELALRDLAAWFGIDPGGFAEEDLSSENRTIGFRSRAFQRVALGFNNRLERFLRRHPRFKRRVRAAYYRINGRTSREDVPADVISRLEQRYRVPNERLAAQLRAAGVALPRWLPQPVAARAVGISRT